MGVHGLPQDVAAWLDGAADRYGVPRSLARAVAWVESRGRQSSVSEKGAIGVMQLMPDTAKTLGVDPHDLVQNIFGGVQFLAFLIHTFGESAALAAYNWGPKHVHDGTPWPDSVRTYVADVQQRANVELAQLEGNPTGKLPFSPLRSDLEGPSASPWSDDSEGREHEEKED
jgi:soluble lytic murein transglycosylase-like protein